MSTPQEPTHAASGPSDSVTVHHASPAVAERFTDPGLPEHRPRRGDLDPAANKRAERQVVVLFGGNLPEVAKKFGSTYSQLRRSLQDIQQQFRDAQREVDRAMRLDDPPKSSAKSVSYDDEEDDTPEPSAPKFTPPS